MNNKLKKENMSATNIKITKSELCTNIGARHSKRKALGLKFQSQMRFSVAILDVNFDYANIINRTSFSYYRPKNTYN